MPEPTPIATTADSWHDRIAEVRDRLEDRPDPAPIYPSEEELLAHERRWEARIPLRYRHARLDQLTGELAEVADWDGQTNVLLLGNVGAGKTHAAVALARVPHDQGRDVLFRSALGLIDDVKPDGDQQALDRAIKADVLVLDDLGTERRTDFAADRISRLLVERYDDCRPTIVTSNLAPDVLESQVGERAWSRLYHDALRIKTAGYDRRRA